MLFYPNIVDKMASIQGMKYRNKKLKEGFTQAFPNPSLSTIKQRDKQFDDVSQMVSNTVGNLARSQNIVDRETKDFLTVASRDQKYLNQNVQTRDGTLAYVTGEGIFKPFNSSEEAQLTMGRNGCPSQVLQINTGPNTYTDDGKNITGEIPFAVGSPMVNQQGCGMAGENIFVGKISGGSGKTQYKGCKSGTGDMIPTGFSIPMEAPACPAGTFGCRGGEKGYCYDPKRNQMVSTYMNPTYDKPIGSTGNGSPFLAEDGVTHLWFRQGGFDRKCGEKPTVPPCPKGTASCNTNQYGYCWDLTRNAMVTTASPYGGETIGQQPNYMVLVQGNMFNYDEKQDKFVSPQKPNVQRNQRQSWVPDRQFTSSNVNPQNKINLQFKAAAAQLMRHLEIGQSAQLRIISGSNIISWNMQPNTGNKVADSVNINGRSYFGSVQLRNVYNESGQLIPRLFVEQQGNTLYLKSPSPSWWKNSYTFMFDQNPNTIFGSSGQGGYNSNGSTFIVTKDSETSATGLLQYGSSSMTTTFKYSQPIKKILPGFIAADGRTRVWKVSDGYNQSCGAEPSVPPTLKSKELIDKCGAIAAGGGFPFYGIKDNECYVGNKIDDITPGNGCVSVDGGEIGKNGDMAAYHVEGASNSGLYKYGFITADQTLKEYPKNMMKPTGEYNSIGKKDILRANNKSVFSNIQGPNACKESCITQYGENCEAYRYNGGNRQCEAYGKGTLDNAMIIPSQQDGQVYIADMAFDNDASCPKNFKTVDSNVWDSLPKAGLMSETTLCDLGAVTSQAMNRKRQDLAELDQALSQMEQIVTDEVNSDKKIRPKLSMDGTRLQKDIQEYHKLYEGLTSMDSQITKNTSFSLIEGQWSDFILMGATALFAGVSLMSK